MIFKAEREMRKKVRVRREQKRKGRFQRKVKITFNKIRGIFEFLLQMFENEKSIDEVKN